MEYEREREQQEAEQVGRESVYVMVMSFLFLLFHRRRILPFLPFDSYILLPPLHLDCLRLTITSYGRRI